jgi:hypothetical protein
MTPEQAKTKWCPFARSMVWIGERGVMDSRQNVPATEHSPAVNNNCIADKCMGWRWETSAPFGYCGLAGK